jgi:hypothetical protein
LVIALLIIGIKIIVVGATELQAVKRLISKSRRFLKLFQRGRIGQQELLGSLISATY